MQRINPMNLTLQAYEQYRTTYPAIELIGGVLYDTVQYTTATTLQIRFFDAVRATLNLSNMETPSMLTNNKGFLIRAVRFRLLQNPRTTARAAAGNVQVGAVDNIGQLIHTGVFTFTIGAKPYMEFPLWTMPEGGGPFGIAGLSGDAADPGSIVDYASNGVPTVENVLSLSQPLFISPLINFFGQINWGAAITLSGGSQNIQIVLDGDLMRPVQ